MKLRSILSLILCVTLLCGCQSILPANGTLSLAADDIDHITVTDMLVDDGRFTVQDREEIRKILGYLNGYTLEDGVSPLNGSIYHLELLANDGETVCSVSIVSKDQLTVGDQTYSVNVKDLLQYVEALECDTMTDSALIDALLTGDTLDQLSIIDDDGKISLDKITGLTASCPALFELLSRPSAIQSVGSYGLEAIENALNSNNIDLRQHAEALAEIIKEYLPDFSEQIDQLLGK